ncbi:hypothetical protein GcM3_204045 [Golovinomyces cichoracearum]|uniref:RNase H type-1 domain-containing protein n=1 Tax=Golovinomyces cichoracearum TaxID=62708 RepID=A0A420HCA1_9PEZI|nr:hypothetical protein GcM3_204045 [Golovinomyces cichoracearum]
MGESYVAHQGGQKIITGNFCLQNFAEAMDAKITAIAEIQAQSWKIRQFQNEWLSRRRLTHVAQEIAVSEWIRGHSSNPGNNEADRLIKLGSKMPVSPLNSHTDATSKKFATKLLKDYLETW